MGEIPLLFLDANILASPVTRTLVIAGARADGLQWTWSKHVEAEADRHSRHSASRTSTVRTAILGTELSPSAQSTKGMVTRTNEDRQVIADAIHAGARYLITTDVDDFAFEDLAAHQMSAVTPDYFMASRFTKQAYKEGVGLLASVQKKPPRTEFEVHRMLGRRHPHLAARFADTYETSTVPADADQPSLLFRGVVCIHCDAQLSSGVSLRVGLCTKHLPNAGTAAS